MISFFKKTKIFSGCSDDHLKMVGGFTETVTVPRGATIIEATHPADYLYLVSKGSVDLQAQVRHYNATTAITLERIESGKGFGWSALVEPHSYTLSAVAMENCELNRVKGADLLALCEKEHDFGYQLLCGVARVIARRFATAERLLIAEIQHTLDQKELAR